MNQLPQPSLHEVPVSSRSEDSLDFSPEIQQANSDYMLSRLQVANAALENQLLREMATTALPGRQSMIAHLFEEVDNGGDLPAYLGIRLPRQWFRETVQRLLEGGTVTVEAASLCATVEFDTDDFTFVKDTEANQQQIAFTTFLQSIIPPTSRVGFVAVAHNTWCPAHDQLFNLAASEAYVAQAATWLQEWGLEASSYTLLSAAAVRGEVDDTLIPKLEAEGWGSVRHQNQSQHLYSTYFNLYQGLYDVLPSNMRNDPHRSRIPLKFGAKETYAALHAVALLSVMRNDSMHITFSDRNHYGGAGFYDKVYTLLRAAGAVRQEQLHTVYYPKDQVTSSMLVYALGRELERCVAEVTQELHRYDSFEHFDPYDYVRKNYGKEEIVADDQDISLLAMQTLEFLGIQDAAAVDLGCGPNPYPSMFLAPHCARIDLLEYATRVRQCVE